MNNNFVHTHHVCAAVSHNNNFKMNNIFSILNGYNNIIKISRIEYNMKPMYIYEFENKLIKYKLAIADAESRIDNYRDESDLRSAERELENLKSDEFMSYWSINDHVPRSEWKNKKICEFMDVIPFTPSIMINISPDWDDTKIDRISTPRKIKFLQNIIESYMAECERYDKYSYVIENGESGNNIHAHIVAHINPRLSKSVETHINKNKHVYPCRQQIFFSLSF